MDDLVNQLRELMSQSELAATKQSEANSDFNYKINSQKRELIETRKELTEAIKEKVTKEATDKIEGKIE